MFIQRTLHPQLRDYREQHEAIRARVARLLDGITPEQFNHVPAPGRWTVGQNLEHLSLEAFEQIAIIRRLINRGRMNGIEGDGPYYYGAWGEWYIAFTEPPYRVKVPTLARYTPAPRLEIAPVASRFFALKAQLLELIDAANGLDLARLSAPLPYLSGWNPSLALGQWFAYTAAHERRHLWQIEQVMTAAGYPAPALPYVALAAA
jgi:hypothetical protein